MANIKFVIRGFESGTPQTISVTARFGRNEKLMYATPLKVDPKFWDAERQRAKVSKYYRDHEQINGALDGLSEAISHFVATMVRDGGEISKNSLRVFLDTHFGRTQAEGASFHDFYLDFIVRNDARVNSRRGGQVITYRTKREYINTFYRIKEYERESKSVLDFNDIDQDFLADFTAFLQRAGLATNTIAHKISNIKTIMGIAVDRGYTDNERWRSFCKTTERTFAVSLSEDELQRIYEYDFSKSPRLERVRDLFLAGCWTGLRFSDLTRLRKENVSNDVITIVQSKTESPVVIPVHPVFRRIWEKYDGVLPARISNQRFNIYIKEVCAAVGIKERVLKSITKGGKRSTTSYEKWQLVTSHTARRSFATNLYKSGFPSISIMQITGHKTETAFLRYIKVAPEEHARLLAQHWKNQNQSQK